MSSSSFSPAVLAKFHRQTGNLRNVCILAHVDHGKTTLADALLASNGIISKRMSGKMRYMDSRQDEQQRGITMKSSAVTLFHRYGEPEEAHLVNIIDSPGHVDFSMEVSTAVRMSDGAIVLVDVVEGVSAQTHAVLRQAWAESIRPCLVLNKIDRLILELQLTPDEAYSHLQRILEQVNAITASLFSARMVTEQERREQERAATECSDTDAEQENMFEHFEQADKELYFEPERGNVVFASAIDGWGFTVAQFAETIAKKLKCRREPLIRCLWGDYFVAKTKEGIKIKKGAYAQGKPPLFVKFVLASIWDAYQAVVQDKDKEKIQKMVKSLNLKVTARDLQQESRTLLNTVFSQWLPLSKCVLDMVCRCLPHPGETTSGRVQHLLYGHRSRSSFPEETLALEPLIEHSVSKTKDGTDTPLVAYVSKMVVVDWNSLPENRRSVVTDADELRRRREILLARRREAEAARLGVEPDALPVAAESPEGEDATQPSSEPSSHAASSSDEEKDKRVFLGYVRVFSGVLRPGQQVFVIHPKHDPLNPGQHLVPVTIEKLYLFMGRELLPVEEAPAGTVVGVKGLEGVVLKSATLSTTKLCPSLSSLHTDGKPVVRVALDTESIRDLPALKRGLELLNQADPSVEVFVQATGEHVLVAAGEVHIERCLTDLKELFAPGVKISVSPPIIPFRETIVPPPTVDAANEAISATNIIVSKHDKFLLGDDIDVDDDGVVTVSTSNKRWNLRVRARPLPKEVTDVIEEHTALLEGYAAVVTATRELLRRQHARSRTTSTSVESGAGANDSSGVSTEASIPEDKVVGGSVADEDVEAAPEGEHVDAETLAGFVAKLHEAMAATSYKGVRELADSVLGFGPHGTGLCLLCSRLGVFQQLASAAGTGQAIASPESLTDDAQELLRYFNGIVVGFELTTRAGPLCEEPVFGVCFELVDVEINEDVEAHATGFGGQVIAAAKEACRQAFLVQPTRLMTAMYRCELFVKSASLGKVYSVISRRSGKVLSEEMKEGSDSFVVTALLPVTDIFGFAEELRKRTSGLAVPQLFFSHWEVYPEDPFWVPTTEEELLHFGDKGDAPNIARKHMFDVRKRKGLAVEEKIVEHAEKQRNVSKKK